MLMPLGQVLEILTSADLDHFVDQGGIRAQWNSLQERATGMFLVREGGVAESDKKATRGPHVEIKMFELGLDYDFELVRYMLAQRSFKKVASSHSGRLELARQTIHMWATVITAEKNWQMAAGNPRMPDSTYLPWRAKSIYEMPVVAWLRRQCDQQNNKMRDMCGIDDCACWS